MMRIIKVILIFAIMLLLVSCETNEPEANTTTPSASSATQEPTTEPTTEPMATPTAEPTAEPTSTPAATSEATTSVPETPTPEPTEDFSDVDVYAPTMVDVSHYMASSYYKAGDGFEDAVDLKDVTSSTALEDQAGNSYGPENLYDFDLDTVWSEGGTGLGIGEWAMYKVRAVDYAPNAVITCIEVINGYIKTDELFEDNAAAKEILVTVDDENWCILSLERVKQIQQFDIPDIPLNTDTDVVLKFIILDAYAGEAYYDTCITAIEFCGTGIY